MEMFCCEITEKLKAYESAPVKNRKSVYSILSHELSFLPSFLFNISVFPVPICRSVNLEK